MSLLPGRLRPWHYVIAIALVLYITGPQVEFDWNDGSVVCPAGLDVIRFASGEVRCEDRARPATPTVAAKVVPTERHVALRLTNPRLRIFSADFVDREFLGFAVCPSVASSIEPDCY